MSPLSQSTRNRIVLPLTIVAVAFVAAGGMVAARPAVETRRPEVPLPLVRVLTTHAERVQLRVEAQGSVVPHTESQLVAEVSGRIVWTSPSLASGGFLEEGDVVIRIDPTDYEIGVTRAEAALARAESELALARANRTRQNQLAERGVASPAALENAANAEHVAEAVWREAGASLEQARRDLQRSEVRSPFAGRVREKHVDVGQFVARGAPVARIYAVDYAEVRLPLRDADAAFVDLPIAYRDDEQAGAGPEVWLHARFAGQRHSWLARIVRTEGELDPRTRMIHAVARVENPYGRGAQPDRPPLSVGMFVEAEILGREVEDVVVIPRSALRGDDRVVVVDESDHLRLREVRVLKRNHDSVLVSGGLAEGERVCTTPLSVAVDGMSVRTLEEPPPDPAPRSAT